MALLPPVPRFVPPADRLTYQPSERRVRGMKGTVTVVDSNCALLVWEPGVPVPFYALALADVVDGVLSPAAKPPAAGMRADSAFFDLTVDGRVTANAAWTYPGEVFAGTVCFAWREWSGQGMDRWYEEDEQIFVHPRDPFERIDALASSRHVRVTFGEVLLADTHRPVLLFETGLPTRYYVVADDITPGVLDASSHRTRCPYKGIAWSWSLAGRDVAWSYPDPLPGLEIIAGRLAFYPDQVRLTVVG